MRLRFLILSLWLPIIIAQKKFFMQLFRDAGVTIKCPSENKVYVHPITGDLQQCSQKLGQYNETSCPGGTVCERFPIQIPGFQDYCCWTNKDTGPDDEETLTKSGTSIPDELIPFTEKPKRKKIVTTVVEPFIERPDSGEIIDGEVSLEKKKSESDEDEDIEWEFETTRRTKRPRSRTTTTTTEEPETTTTKKSISVSRRLPRCNNPDDNPLIDFGNRLRDCYFQTCYQGFRCEFNKEIRRFICCGQAREIAPPAGLPPIPEPKRLISRPFRPGPRPFGMVNDADNDMSQRNGGCPWQNNNNNCNANQWSENNGCNQNGCGNTNLPSPPQQKSLPPAQSSKPQFPQQKPTQNWNGNDCGQGNEGCGWQQNNFNNNNNNRFNQIPPPQKPNLPVQIPTPPQNIPEPQPLTRIHGKGPMPQKMKKLGPMYPNPSDNDWKTIDDRPRQPNDRPRPEQEFDFNDNGGRWQGGSERSNGELSESFTGGYGSMKRKDTAPPSSEPQCAAGREYRLSRNAPRCTPPGADSCPMSHPRCIQSPSLGHHVCCL